MQSLSRASPGSKRFHPSALALQFNFKILLPDRQARVKEGRTPLVLPQSGMAWSGLVALSKIFSE